jgi:hypothetical protein
MIKVEEGGIKWRRDRLVFGIIYDDYTTEKRLVSSLLRRSTGRSPSR